MCVMNFVSFRYPKDAEKHLLSVKSGLTKSQVHTTVASDCIRSVWSASLHASHYYQRSRFQSNSSSSSGFAIFSLLQDFLTSVDILKEK